jgi:hypothetical protein
MRSTLIAAAALSALALTGCTVGGSSPNMNNNPDAGPGPSVDAPAGGGGCALAPTIGTIGAVTVELHNQPGSMGQRQFYILTASLSSDPSDKLELQLWGQTGAFSGAVATGTYPITGAETQYASCGACAFALGDTTKPTSQLYLASAGTINVTALGAVGQPVTVQLTGVTFGQLDATTHTAGGGGCHATAASLTLTGTLLDKTSGGGGGGVGKP